MPMFLDEVGDIFSCITRLAAAAGRVVSLMRLNEAFIILKVIREKGYKRKVNIYPPALLITKNFIVRRRPSSVLCL